MFAVHFKIIASIVSPCRFAYMEFDDECAVNVARALDESIFKGRQIKVSFN